MGPVDDVVADLESRAASFVKEHRLPGAAAGVVHGDVLAWSAGIGFAEVGARRLAKPTTVYLVASITKTFTGTAVMQLCDAGRLTLDDPVVAHIRELRSATSPFGPIETITIRRLLSHESGLITDPPGTDWAVPAYEGMPERTLARVDEIGTKLAPNLQQKYSNLGYQLLGEIVARVTRTPYPQYVKESILDPLAMSSSGFEPLPDTLLARRATGYAPRTFSDELEPAPALPPLWAEGGMWSSVEDLARWISFQLGAYGDGPSSSTVLPAERLREMHRPRYIDDDEWTQARGISWNAIRRNDVVWVQHSGGLHGFKSNVCFDPTHQVGAVVLLNGTADASALAMDLAEIARRSVRGRAPAIEPPQPTPEAFRPLLGLYAQPELGTLVRLEWRDARLTFVDPDLASWRPSLVETDDPDTFVVGPGCDESGETVVFQRLSDGRVASALLASTTLARLGPVVPDGIRSRQ